MRGGQYRITALITLLITSRLAFSIQYIHDELLYTKQLWEENKLDFPFAVFKDEEPAIAKIRDSLPFGSGAFHSLNGPLDDLKERIEEDIRRGSFQPNSFEISLLDDDTQVTAPSLVVQCKACHTLVTHLWTRIQEWTHQHLKRVDNGDLVALVDSLCSVEVPVEILKDWVILSARVQQVLVDESGKGQANKEQYYLLNARGNPQQVAKEKEIAVVRQTCKNLLLEGGGENGDLIGAQYAPILQAATKAQHKYIELLQSASGLAVESQATVVDDYDSLPPIEPQRICYNRHPQCEYWAAKGECKANPNYMVGHDGGNGWCRLACEVCTPPKPYPFPDSLLKSEVIMLYEASKTLVEEIQKAACSSLAGCLAASKESLVAQKAKLQQDSAKIDRAGLSVIEKSTLIIGPIDTTINHGALKTAAEEELDHILAQSTVSLMLDHQSSAVPRDSLPTPPPQPSVEESTSIHKDIQQVLWTTLGGQCIYASSGWWSYELCYRSSILQYHAAPERKEIDWVISLGVFDVESDGAKRKERLENVSDAALYPGNTNIPAYQQLYTHGNECEITGENGVHSVHQQMIQTAGRSNGERNIGDTVERASLVRFICSPDDKKHLVVSEPVQCEYLVDVYLPQLCGMAGMQVETKYQREVTTAVEEKEYYNFEHYDEDEDAYLDPDDDDAVVEPSILRDEL